MIVKVCGLSQARNVAQVAALGVDLLGFIFSKQSPRCVTASAAARASLVAGEAMTVGVFVDEAPATIVRTVAAARLGCVQ
ncbi:MAG: phosphoribosylanthranilate isomerase, partial [Bacteroidales bacterium]|nr:phosphoribosylanthranilate isomerase [Bacteroidales bacterium]